jgi:hypothetical protein
MEARLAADAKLVLSATAASVSIETAAAGTTSNEAVLLYERPPVTPLATSQPLSVKHARQSVRSEALASIAQCARGAISALSQHWNL